MSVEDDFQQHPLVKVFHNPDYVTLYDARSHFAVNMEARHLEVLHDALGYRTGNERETRSKQYLELQRLIDLGIFASGPFQETYTTDREALGHTVRHYSTHTITRKFRMSRLFKLLSHSVLANACRVNGGAAMLSSTFADRHPAETVSTRWLVIASLTLHNHGLFCSLTLAPPLRSYMRLIRFH